MKIIFDKIITNKDTLKISLDNGATSVEKPVSELLSNGYSFTEDDCLDLNNIQLGNSSTSKKKPSFTAEQNNVFKSIVRYYATTGANLEDYLSTLDENTPETPYKIKLLDFSGFKNPTKYVDIKISDSANVTTLNTDSFTIKSNVTSVILPSSVTEIGIVAFLECSNLVSITIPNSVGVFNSSSFKGCTKLRTINYKGTVEQWNAIRKDLSWNEGVPSDCVINYNYQG